MLKINICLFIILVILIICLVIYDCPTTEHMANTTGPTPLPNYSIAQLALMYPNLTPTQIGTLNPNPNFPLTSQAYMSMLQNKNLLFIFQSNNGSNWATFTPGQTAPILWQQATVSIPTPSQTVPTPTMAVAGNSLTPNTTNMPAIAMSTPMTISNTDVNGPTPTTVSNTTVNRPPTMTASNTIIDTSPPPPMAVSNTAVSTSVVNTCPSNILLDSIQDIPSCAYSVRLLSSKYKGSAINVRRSSDGQMQDIGFDKHGNLNIIALLAFVGFGSGYVTIWYDQSGNRNDATQKNPLNQPRIVFNGTVDNISGTPNLLFTNAWLNINTYPFKSNTNNVTIGQQPPQLAIISLVSKVVSPNGWARYFDFGSDTNNYIFASPNSGNGDMRFGIKANGAPEQTLAVANQDKNTHVMLFANIEMKEAILQDGLKMGVSDIKTAVVAPTVLTATNNYIGRSQYSGDPLINAYYGEFITFSNIPDHNLDILQKSQMSYFIN